MDTVVDITPSLLDGRLRHVQLGRGEVVAIAVNRIHDEIENPDSKMGAIFAWEALDRIHVMPPKVFRQQLSNGGSDEPVRERNQDERVEQLMQAVHRLEICKKC